METKSSPLTQYLEMVNKGHILYLYESLEDYIENAVAYGMTGIKYGHQVFFVENEEVLSLLQRELGRECSSDKICRHVHYVDSKEFYGTHGDFNYVTIVKYFEKMLQPFLLDRVTLRTWAHVQWKQQDNIAAKLEEFETIADDSVSGMQVMSVCAYDANTLPASLVSRMLRSHDMYMTDKELVKSPIYTLRDRNA